MRRALLMVGVALAAGVSLETFGAVRPDAAVLKNARDFQSIGDARQRSQALFVEAGKVLQHPRCMNCHPAGDRPLQGDDAHLHNPPVVRSAADFGAPGMECVACHTTKNTPIQTTSIRSVPGNPQWRLAPVEMAWEGKTIGQICALIKDRARNGGRDLASIHDHMAHDELVGWGWNPGAGRTPAPGTQQQFGELIQAWIDTGAVCPGS